MLNDRLVKIKEKFPTELNHDFPKALKILGNEASHVDGAAREDVVFAFKFVESILHSLYDKSAEILEEMAKEIAERKK